MCKLPVQFFGSAGGRGGFGGGFGSGFGGAGGRSRAQQGEDEKYELKLDFLDAVFGAKYAPQSSALPSLRCCIRWHG